MNIKVVFCEGVHDIAFIEKILIAHDYKEYKRKSKDYPHPLNGMIKENSSKVDIMSGKGKMIPLCAVTKGEDLVLFHNMNGLSSTSEVKNLITQYSSNKIALGFDNPDNIENFYFYLFYDADELGVEGRLEWIRDEFCAEYSIPRDAIAQGKRTDSGTETIGTYVFFDNNESAQKGVLEDQLLRLMQDGNEDIFNSAKDFLLGHKLDDERCMNYNPSDDTYYGKASKNYELKKSIIGVAGQLQFSGANNSTIIESSDYIKRDDILNDSECEKIFMLLSM